MKRFSIILLGALAMLMAGCSKDTHTASKESDDWMLNLDLPVPIEFGSASLDTKAAFTSMDDLLTTSSVTHAFGVFAIDKEASSIADDVMLLKNERTIYTETGEGKVFQFANTANVKQPKYYPMLSEVSYDFYGYYSREKDLSEIIETSSTLSVKVDVGSFTSDILWAKATTGFDNAGEPRDGYNARYIRKGNPLPKLNFQHVTSCLNFRAVYAPIEGETTAEMSKINVTALKVKNIHKTAELRIIDLDNPQNESELFVTGSATDVDINGSSTPDTDLINNKVGGNYAPAALCDEFFIAPQDEPLDVQFVINYQPVGSAATMSQTVTYRLDPSKLGARLDESTGQVVDKEGNPIRLFEAGYKYGFNIKIYSPEEIKIEVDLQPYEDAFNGGFADIDFE